MKTRDVKVCLFCFLVLFGTLLDTLWGVFSCLWGVNAIKKARFSRAWGPGLAKGGVSPCPGPLALQTYRVFLRRAPRTTQKTTIDHACPWLWAAGHSKEGPSSLTLTLDQQPDKRNSTETNKRPTTSIGSPTAAVWAQQHVSQKPLFA